MEALSSDKEAQRLARERETAVLVHQHLFGSSFHAGKAERRAEGIVEGRAEGLRRAVRTACSLLGTELDAAKTQRLDQFDAEQLDRVLEGLESERRWPEGI